MDTNDKATVLALVSRLPEHATLLDLAQEAGVRGPAARARSAHRERLADGTGLPGGMAPAARERAVRFAERMLPLFSHGRN